MRRLRVLVVDDEPSLLQLLRVTLESEGHDVLLASDGETAVRRIVAERPDIVLLDVMMPVLDGWGVLQEVKSLEAPPRVVCLTAKAGRRDQLKGWQLGTDEYVTKPFNTERLLELVQEVVARSAEEQEARRREALAALGETAPPAGG